MRRILARLSGPLVTTMVLGVPLPAQAPGGSPFSAGGVLRTSALVDSVYLDRTRLDGTADGGDFTSYLLARLGVRRIPDDLGFRVAVDTGHILISGTVADFPQESHAVLAPLFAFVGPETPISAGVTLTRAGPRAVHFRLHSATLGGFLIPEALLQSVLGGVGAQYPALTASGRDLYVEVPTDAGMNLVPGGIHLTAPPPPAATDTLH